MKRITSLILSPAIMLNTAAGTLLPAAAENESVKEYIHDGYTVTYKLGNKMNSELNLENIYNWNNENIGFIEDINAFYFKSNSEYEEAVCVIPVPKGSQSFSVKLKAGNSCDVHKIGYQDCGYISIGFGDYPNMNECARSTMLVNNTEFINLYLGNESNPLPIYDASSIYIKAEAYNSSKDEIDFYFGDISVSFYEANADNTSYDNWCFIQEDTDEKAPGNKPIFISFLYVLVIVIIIVIFICKLKKQDERESHNKSNE